MTDPIRWGILGTGSIAHAFTHDLLATATTVTAVGSRTQQSADAFAHEFGISTAHGSYEALVDDPNVDVIYVSTPHVFHAENALLALAGGKHVLVEKPFTVNATEARRIAALGAEKNLVVLEAMWTRWLPHMVRLREILASGVLGDIRTVIADHNQRMPFNPEGRMFAPELGGGALLDLGIYPVSFAHQVLGKPQKITATASFTSTGVDASTSMIFGYEGGRSALLQTQLDAAGPNRAVIVGTEGRVEIDPVFYSVTSFTVFDAAGTVTERFEHSLSTRGMDLQAREVERLVRSAELISSVLPVDETISIMETLDEVRAQIGLRYPGE